MNPYLKTETYTLYLAGGLFNAAERYHCARLEKHLQNLGWRTILPQREALKFLDKETGTLNLKKVADDCLGSVTAMNTIVVACLDGADTDSGTALEVGAALANNSRVIAYRTDFRTDTDKEIGVNAMFRAGNSEFIYFPCFAVEESDFEKFYEDLAKKIDAAAQ